MRYRSSFSPLRSIERTFILTQIPIAESAARPPHNLPRVRSLAAFGRRPWCSPLHLDGSVAELRADQPIVRPLILVTLGNETPEVRRVLDAATTIGGKS